MKSRIVPTAVFLGLLCAVGLQPMVPALAQQQPVVVRKTSLGTARGPSAPIAGSGSLGGKAMLKPGQAFVGGKISAPPNTGSAAASGGANP
jgi:hypothetical protein